MYAQIRKSLTGLFALLILSSASLAGGLSTYNQDFENLNIGSGEVGGGYLFFIGVFDSNVNFKFGYGGAAPNGTGQISGLVDNQGGVPQGTQQLSVFSDYSCCDLGEPTEDDQGHGNGTDLVENNVFIEQTVASSNVGETWTFTFDAKKGDPADGGLGGDTTALAFIKVLDPLNDFSVSQIVTVDLTNTSLDWDGKTLSLTIGNFPGQILQFGWQSTASNFDDSAIFYDNVTWSGGIDPLDQIEEFSDNFESYNSTAISPLGDAGYLIFGQLRDAFGQPIANGNYGPFPAPNSTNSETPDAFSAIAVDQGGLPQGAQQLSVFGDYQNPDRLINNNLLESIVYREEIIGAANIGETWEFSFDTKRGNLAPPSTAEAFIKVLDPSDGFSLTDSDIVSLNSASVDWERYTLSVTIESDWVGQLFQIGFATIFSGDNASGMFYDNINLAPPAIVDTDGDGESDITDNCTLIANPDQLDGDMDGIGNLCDGDYNGDCESNISDLAILRGAFLSNSSDMRYRPEVDHNGDGTINLSDLAIFRGLFLEPVGPPVCIGVTTRTKRAHKRHR